MAVNTLAASTNHRSRAPFAGVYPPIATPFDEQGGISVEGLKHNLARWNQTDLTGLVVLGSNGEFPLIDDDERDVIIRTVREHAREGLRIIVGTGRESTRATIRTTQRAADLGADAAIVVHPSYYTGAMTDAVLYEYYRCVAAASPIPILLYNVPPYTGVNLSATLVARLAELDHVVGVKDTSANIVQIADIVRLTRDSFTTLAGSASFLLASLAVGAHGGILALANMAPEACIDLVRRFEAGDLAGAQGIQRRMLPVNAAITTRFGAGGLKTAMELRGYYGGIPRPPLLPVSAAVREEIRQILLTAGLL